VKLVQLPIDQFECASMFSVGCGYELKGGVLPTASWTRQGTSERVALGEGNELRRGSGVTLRFGLLVFVDE
jgi:hypothetical protein